MTKIQLVMFVHCDNASRMCTVSRFFIFSTSWKFRSMTSGYGFTVAGFPALMGPSADLQPETLAVSHQHW